MNRILRSQLPPNPRDLAVFDTTTGSSPGRTRRRNLLKLTFFFAFLLSFASVVNAQSSTACATPANNNGNGKVTFNFQNTNAYAVVITDISSVSSLSGSVQSQIWYRTSALSYGSAAAFPAVNATNWTLGATNTFTGVANTTTTTPQSFFNGNLSIVVPAGATYGFCLNAANASTLTSGALRYSSLTAGTSYTYPAGGCNILSGGPTASNASAAGAPVASSQTFANVPRGFIGCVTFAPLVPCSGTPNNGVAAINTSNGCANVSLGLSASGLSTGTGLTYQWQSSTDGGTTWNNISGATTAGYTLSAGVSVNTSFRLQSTCSNSSTTSTSNTVSYAVTATGPCLCGAYPAIFASSTADEDISNVTVGSMNNSSTCSTVAGGSGSILNRYSNYSGVITGPTAVAGSTVPFSLTMTTCGGNYTNFFQIYVDYNQDGDFLDVGEQVYSQTTTVSGNQTVTGSFIIPISALAGTTRMRVVNSENSPSTTNYAHTAYTWGETEDYCFTIVQPVQCSGTPVAATAAFSGAAAICQGQTKTMTGSGISTDLGITVEWKVSATPGGPYTAVNGGIGSTTSSYTTPASQGAGTYYYVLVSTCSNSGLTSTSNEIALTINAAPTVIISAPNGGALCGTQQLTVTGAQTYVWSPSTSLSATTGSTVTFTGTAAATISVTGTGSNGCTATATQAVTYTAPTPITFTSSVPNFCGTGGTATLTASSSAPYSYTFAALDGAVLSNTTATTVDATISQTSAVQVTGTDSGTGCSAQTVVSIGVYPLPSATVTTTASGVCPGTAATINSGLSAGTFSVSPIGYNYMAPPSTASVGPNGDDVVGGPYNIGFSYNYFGNVYTQFYISTNGNIQFGPTTSTSYTPGLIPATAAPNNFVALGWADLLAPAGSIKYWVQGYAPNRILVIDYNAIPFFGGAAGTSESGQIRLYETLGTVEVHLTNSNGLASTGGGVKSLGVENVDGTIGAAAPGRNNSAWTTTVPEAWRFTPPANYLTVWSAVDANNPAPGYSVTTNVDGSTVNVINGFSATVAPLLTTTYSISYSNATTGCSNALSPAQVTMAVLGTVAPQGVSAISNVTTACPGANINLSTNYTGLTDGLTFRWQVSTDGGATWTDIAGAAGAGITCTTTQTVASMYRLRIVSCGGTPSFTSTVSVALTGFIDCYCGSTATSIADEEISNVTVGTVLNNSSTCTTLAPGAGSVQNQYSNYTTLTPANLVPGVAYPISVTQTSCGGAYTNTIGAWIDFNQNGLFTDAGEQILLSASVSGNQTATANFTIPTAALTGLTRMRVVVTEATTVSPCGNYTWGETEDYFVNIVGPCDPTLFTAPLATADDPDATVCGTQTSQLTAFDFNGVANPVYMWYDAPTGGNLLQNSTSNFYTPGPITATTTWYVATYTGSCITQRFPVTLNWVAPPAITVGNSNPVFCGSTGSPTNLSVTSSNAGYTYTWSAFPATGSGLTAGTTGATVNGVTPTVNGVYTYTVAANDATSGCTASATTTVGFYSPLTGTATVTQPTVCGGNGSVNFAVNGSGTVFTSDFSSATLNPAQASLCSGAVITGGQLRLTPPVNSSSGGILITNTTGVASNDFQIDFDMITTAGTTPPADGFSYSYGPDVVCMPTPGATTGNNILVPAGAANPENGSGSGIRLSFDAYTNGVNVNGIYLMYNCLRMNPASTLTPADGLYYYAPNTSWIGGATTHVTITINGLGQMSMWLNGTQVLNNAQLPAAYLTADKSTWKHAFAARTGGLNQGHFIDNLDIHYNNFYEYSVDNGATWTTTSPVSVPAPSTVQNVARYVAVPACSVNLGSAAVAFPVAAPTGVTGGSTCLNGSTLNVSAIGAPINGVQTLTVPLGSNVNLPGAAVSYTLPYGSVTLNGNVSIPAGATITGANLVVNGLTANGATWLSELQVSLSGVSTIANQVFVAAPAGQTSPTNGGPYTFAASIPTGSGAVTCTFLNTYTGNVTMTSVNLVITYTLPSVPVWFNAATGGSVIGTGNTFNVVGSSYLPNASTPFNGNVYAASVVTNGPSTCYSSTVAAPVTVGQPLTVTVSASAPVTQSFTLASNYSVAAGATQTITGTIAIPNGVTVTSTVLQVNGVTCSGGTWGSDVNIAMSGASTVASQVVANVNTGLTNAGPYNYTASNIASPGGTVYVTFTHNYSFGSSMDFASVVLLVTYTAPVTGSVCPGTSVTMNATTTGGGANPTYQWSLNGSAIAGATSASYVATPAAGSSYTCTVVDACNPSGVTSSAFTPSLFTVTAGTITGPSAILVNDFTAPIPGAGTWTIAGQNTGSTIQWSYGTAQAGPYITIGGATGSSQTLYASGSAGTIYLTATTTTTDGCSIQANVVPVVLGNAIDTPCTAATITMGNQGGQEWSSAAASAQTGETYGAGFTNPGNTIWFKFVAPASGHVSIQTTSTVNWDNYITLYSGSDCSNLAGFTQLGYNDDANGTAQAALMNVTCLVPGATYYIQMRYWSSFTNTVGQAGIILTDLGNVAPTISGISANITVPALTGTCAATATWAAPTASDDQGCVTMTSNFNSGSSFPVGVTTVTYTATDLQGLVTTASFTVTVTDTQLPTITAPAAVTVNANSSCNATGVALGTPVTADNCTVASVTNNAPATFPLGVTTVTWTVTDASNNVATATQTVTVVDVTNPTITAPANVTVNANSSCNATGVALGTPVTADNCSVASVTNNAPATFPLGTTTVTWTVTDGAGLTATATQTVTVVDATNPTITAPANVTVNANSSCNATGVVLGTPVTADNCSVASVTSDAPATFPLGTTTVTWTVTDGAGLTATATQTVTVVDATNPTITAPSAVTVTAALNACTATATLGSATTADNCGVASTTNNAPATFPIGTTTVTWTVTDNSGNTATATQVVTVNVNPANIWYVDADGDGYGVAGPTVLACSQPAGYSVNNTDCNDNNASVNPGAFEICGNAIDDNCSGTAEEGCQFPGENPSNATSITPSVWPACTLTNGTLAGASISGAAQTICLTGEDKWHQFVATSEGISIVVNSTSADILIELQTAAGVLVAQENAVSGLGGEILNHYGLTAGQVYRVGVRNYNSALGTGTYSICVKMLKRGGCDYGPGPYTLCQYFKATWAGATGTNYTFTFTGLTGPAAGNVYTRTQNSDICVLSSVVPTLPYGSTYNVLITNTYSINNGAGVAETISVPALSPCSMTVSTEPTTALRTTDQCAAGPRFRGAVVASLPWVCGATNWRWEFTELNASGQPVGLPITLNRGAASNYINLGTILQLQYGKTYSVRTAPILPYTGTNYQWGAPVCMSIVGTAGMIADGGQANNPTVRMETANEVNMSLYPNPTHGTDVNINLSGVESENVQIRIVDAMGRQVWNNRYSVSGVLNTNITFERPLANGLYMVEAIFNGEVHTQRMMVQK